jgi:hypothetical protein
MVIEITRYSVVGVSNPNTLMAQHLLDIGDNHWIGELYETGGWKRFTLFHIVRNASCGSTSWLIAEIDIVHHPSKDGCNPHSEVKISIRNDIRRDKAGIDVDKNTAQLRHVKDVVDTAILDQAVNALVDLGKVSSPYSVYVCMRHIESFRVVGDFWNDE